MKIFPLKDFSEKKNPEWSRRGTIDQAEIQLHDVMRIQPKDFIYAYDGERILGIVEIDATHILEINKCTIGKQSIIVGNLELNCDDLGDIDVLNKRERKGVKKLYHLLTDTKYLNIENTLFHDYNWSIERLL